MPKDTRFSARAIAVLAALALPHTALALETKRDTMANQVNDRVFEVIARTAGSAPDYWCGAADYARRGLGAPWTATIYITRGRGPSETTGRRTAVQFTLDAAAAPPAANGGFIQVGELRAGDTMSVQRAFQYCYQPPSRF